MRHGTRRVLGGSQEFILRRDINVAFDPIFDSDVDMGGIKTRLPVERFRHVMLQLGVGLHRRFLLRHCVCIGASAVPNTQGGESSRDRQVYQIVSRKWKAKGMIFSSGKTGLRLLGNPERFCHALLGY